MIITGKDLIALGYAPAGWFGAAIAEANTTGNDLAAIAKRHQPPAAIPLQSDLPFFSNITPENDAERANVDAVKAHMVELMKVPTVRAGAIMPDACPADKRLGTIPVGGVVSSTDIHPGMHSADICCSMAISIFDDANPTAVLDAGMRLSHFGGGGRPRGEQWPVPVSILQAFERNPFLKGELSSTMEHFGTQGDGNHFFYVGRVASSGKIALVTHHGSRRPGAMLYKGGMVLAEKTRRRVSPETHEQNAWIVADSREGNDYWQALQIIREWTKASHFSIHNKVASALNIVIDDRFWNEHNFVFQKSDGLFYHAKGATPAFDGYAKDASGLTLIPLNMAEPVLITKGLNADHGLGFAPHGAGRNFSRTAHMRSFGDRSHDDIFAEETKGLDARSFCGIPDISELPSAYKNAKSVRAQIEQFGLAEIVDTVEPIGSIMAGDWQRDAPWKRKKSKK